VGYAGDWAWSSVRAHLAGKDDGLVTVRPVLDSVSCFADLLLEDRDEAFVALRRVSA
jgi:putative transposase